jgi:mediator of RNA polymerase II transcription subunit 25
MPTGIPRPPTQQQFSPAVAAQLQRLTPDQRNTFLAQMMNRARQQQSQQSQQPQQQQFQSLRQPQQPQQPNYNLNTPNLGDSNRFDAANFQQNFLNLLGNHAPGVNPAIDGTMMSTMGSQTQGGMGGLHLRTPSGNPIPQSGGLGGVSYEVLQSFMQRNVDGSGSN